MPQTTAPTSSMVIQTIPQQQQHVATGFTTAAPAPIPVQYQQQTTATETVIQVQPASVPVNAQVIHEQPQSQLQLQQQLQQQQQQIQIQQQIQHHKASPKPARGRVSKAKPKAPASTDTANVTNQETVEHFEITEDGKLVKSYKGKKGANTATAAASSSTEELTVSGEGDAEEIPTLKMRPARTNCGTYQPDQKMVSQRREAIQAGINEVLSKKSFKQGSGQKRGQANVKANESFLAGKDHLKQTKFGENFDFSAPSTTRTTTTAAATKTAPPPTGALLASSSAAAAGAPPKKLVPISFEEMQKILAGKKPGGAGRGGIIQLKPANCKILPIAKPGAGVEAAAVAIPTSTAASASSSAAAGASQEKNVKK